MVLVDDKHGCGGSVPGLGWFFSRGGPPPPPQEAMEGIGGKLSPGMVKQEEMETPTAPMRSKRSVTCRPHL